MSSDPPLVSVIVAAFQQPAYLNEALRSIAAQTYRNVEIIVIDDASGDEFTSQYELSPNARLIVHEQRGKAAAITRNTGIVQATGEYLAFLDQDDIWLPEKTEWQLALMESRPDLVMTFGHFRWVDQELKELPEQIDPPLLNEDPLRDMLFRNFIECPSQVMIRRSAMDKIGLFDPTIRGTAAWEFYIRAAAAGPMVSDPRVMTLYRQHPAQWSKDSLMMRKGSARTMEKTAGWIGNVRPDLKMLVRRRWSRWVREVARAQFSNRQERGEAMGTLMRALKVWPLDMQSYAVLVKGMMAKVE